MNALFVSAVSLNLMKWQTVKSIVLNENLVDGVQQKKYLKLLFSRNNRQ